MSLVGATNLAYSQDNHFQVGTAFPLQYAVGIEVPIDSIWSVGLDVGLVEAPHDQFIMKILQSTSINPLLYSLLEQSYQKGSMATLRIQRREGWGYWGVLGQKITLRAKDAPISVYETYFEVDFDQFPVRGFRINAPTTLELTSRIYQMGLLVGKEWSLKFLKGPWFLRTELALTANLTSQNTLESPDRVLGSFASDVDVELKNAYRDYAILPSIGIYVVYRW